VDRGSHTVFGADQSAEVSSPVPHGGVGGRSAERVAEVLVSSRGMGVGPTPRAATREAQDGWSTAKGTTTAGTPAVNAAPVVPAPP